MISPVRMDMKKAKAIEDSKKEGSDDEDDDFDEDRQISIAVNVLDNKELDSEDDCEDCADWDHLSV